jgi:hypothetical protein
MDCPLSSSMVTYYTEKIKNIFQDLKTFFCSPYASHLNKNLKGVYM